MEINSNTYTCRICGYTDNSDEFEEDFANHLGYWCPMCDAFSYISDEKEQGRLFLLCLEDSNYKMPLTQKRKIKQNVSPLRYPGGKTKLVPYIAAIIPKGTTRLVEPFCGGASISLSMLSAGIVNEIRINDKDSNVVAFFRTVLNNPGYLETQIKNEIPSYDVFFAYRNSLKYDSLSEEQRAYRYLYCNRTAFSGILGASPMSDITARWNPATLIKRINHIAGFANQITVSQDDATNVIEEEYWRGEDTLLFIDPPYFRQGKRLYPQYYDKQDHVHLASLLESLYCEVPGANMILTYDNEEYIKKLYNIAKAEIIKPTYSIRADKGTYQ